MGEVATLTGKTVYLDTNVIVYAIEGLDEHREFLEALFQLIDAGATAAITSELTLAEALVKPIQVGRQDIIELYHDLLQNSVRLTVLPIDRAVLIEAARYRATFGIRLPDAIHVATAIAGGCQVFLTNDQRLRLPERLELQTPE